ncbi:unnamed protein product [Owenia fusiformis]|uniref:Uncharacterized protein n=1 Tax=Owenia fusiformis TaxID=6347 RepID=A0A8J1T7G7_OWEFU|nr:unnamed protein product [Owenia fusiformis]
MRGLDYLDISTIGTLLLLSITALHAAFTSPPSFTREPVKESAYKKNQEVKLHCEATGNPTPEFTWEKDGVKLSMTGDRYTMRDGSGTLTINSPASYDHGTYQCFAKNHFGSAISNKAVLKEAAQDPFPKKDAPVTNRPLLGQSLILNCQPPAGYPDGRIFWALDSDSEEAINTVELSDRVTQDHNGNLYFANVIQDDKKEGESYMCTVNNLRLRSYVQGDDQTIHPKHRDDIPEEPPRLMWKNQSPQIGMQGKDIYMKCIFAGYPTPVVTWSRDDGRQMPSNSEVASFGQELIIKNAQFEDAGKYKCSAKNAAAFTDITEEHLLVVDSLPFFDTRPENTDISMGEDKSFLCVGNGQPMPSVEWFVNGQPIEEYDPDLLSDDGSMLVFRDLQKDDTAVLQCKAKNKHGQITANAYLNVLAEAPIWSSEMEDTKSAEGTNKNISCTAIGWPKPEIIWRKNSNRLHSGGKYTIHPDGNLEIKDVQEYDESEYECEAANQFGKISDTVFLIVKVKTSIVKGPENERQVAGKSIVLECSATTDQSELSALSIRWTRTIPGFEDVESELIENRLEGNIMYSKLTLEDVRLEESAEYTCVASNELDTATSTAAVTIEDVPSPPTNVKLIKCGPKSNSQFYRARITWTASQDNNSPLERYHVQYKTEYDDQWFEDEKYVTGDDTQHDITKLSPWASYTFRVVARNGVGISKGSKPTADSCDTPSAVPAKHPDNVGDHSDETGCLTITWDAMPEIEHNGEGFHYVVSWAPGTLPADDSTWRSEQVRLSDNAPGKWKVITGDTYKPYVVKVEAVNDEGKAIGEAMAVQTYSGEDEPQTAPSDFALSDGKLNASYATFEWTTVDCSPRNMRGFFVGYRIHFYKKENPDISRSTDIILQSYPEDTLRCDKRRFRRHTTGKKMTGHSNTLFGNSELEAYVVAINRFHEGPSSNVVTFRTPEGVPDEVGMFEILRKGSHHMDLVWKKPSHPNGDLTGYNVEYTALREDGSSIPELYGNKKVTDPSITTVKLDSIAPNTLYRICVAATTAQGNGKWKCLERKTHPDVAPDAPVVDIDILDDTSVNISWHKSLETSNPGASFYMQYRPEGKEVWHAYDETDSIHWRNLTGLTTGVLYEVQVVAINGAGVKSSSEIHTFNLGKTARQVAAATTNIGLIVGIFIVLLIVIVAVIVFVLWRRNRGGKYPVHEREKQRRKDINGPDPCVPSFDEYKPKPLEEEMSPATYHEELEDMKPASDSSSFDEYGSNDPSNFDEQGAFLHGQRTSQGPMRSFHPGA